jgi:hypothetical protein
MSDASSWRPFRATLVILAVGVVLVGVLAWAATANYNSNEKRLLDLQAHQAATTLGAAISTIQTPLVADYQVAVATGDNTASFRTLARTDVGKGNLFVSVSMWRLGPGSPSPLVVVGQPIVLVRHPAAEAAFFRSTHPSTSLDVTRIFEGRRRRVGFAEMPQGSNGTLLVYAESALPSRSPVAVPKGSGFSDLNFAAYLGAPNHADLLESSVSLPITGQRTTVSVPFGDTKLTLVVAPSHPLSGTLSEWLPWIIVVVGAVGIVVAAFITERLLRRRRTAERLATENELLYSQQRSIAETLQHSLLPVDLPRVPGIEFAVRYVPGVRSIDVGGDWYDVINTDSGDCFVVVGDVSGRGLAAATMMASLRYATRAFVAEGYGPGDVMNRLHNLMHIEKDGRFATVMCGTIDVSNHRITLVNAGHPRPLLITDGTARFVDIPVGPPVGVDPSAGPRPVDVTTGNGATLLAFTDGLIERRGQSIDEGMERLRSAAVVRPGVPLDRLLSEILSEMMPDGSDDDIAILGVRWLT